MKKLTHAILLSACTLYLTAAHAQDTEFKPSGNLWGYVFGDFYYKAHGDSLGRGAGNVQYRGTSPSSSNPNPNWQMDAFQIRRAYLGYDYNISKKFSAYAVLADEAGPNISGFPGTNLDAGGSNTVYLKYMYVKWANIFKGSNLLFGQMSTPSFATPFNTEPLWSYRSVERTIMDMHNNDASSEMGVSLQGSLWKQSNPADSLKPTFIGYQIQVGNGASAKPESDRFKKWRGTLFVSAMKQQLTVGVYADYNTIALEPHVFSTTTYKGYAHYKTDWFRIGAEAFQQVNLNADVFKDTSTKQMHTASGIQFGWSAFLSGRILKDKLNYFLRMDMYNPDTKFDNKYLYSSSATGGNMTTTTFYTQTFYTAGFDYTPIPRVHIMPNIWYNSYKTMMDNDAAGKPLKSKVKSDFDFVPRLTFYVIFNSSKSVSNNGMNN